MRKPLKTNYLHVFPRKGTVIPLLFCFFWVLLSGGGNALQTVRSGKVAEDPGVGDNATLQNQLPLEEIGQVLELLIRWREAWERKDLETYISCYSNSFRYKGGGLKEYGRYKRGIFSAAENVQVSMKKFFFAMEPPFVTISFQQDYRADNHEDSGYKVLFIAKERGQWLIRKETWRAKE